MPGAFFRTTSRSDGYERPHRTKVLSASKSIPGVGGSTVCSKAALYPSVASARSLYLGGLAASNRKALSFHSSEHLDRNSRGWGRYDIVIVQKACVFMSLHTHDMYMSLRACMLSCGSLSSVLLSVFSACGGIFTGNRMSLLTAYFSGLAQGILGKLVRGTTTRIALLG